MIRLAAAVLCSLASIGAHAASAPPDRALAAVEAYSRAVATGDCETMAALSAVVARHPEAKEELCAVFAEWHQHGLVERLRHPDTRLASGNDRLVVVPNSRILVFEGRPQITNSVYAAYSNDGGQDWRVIDIACDHLADWIKGGYPAYDGHPAFGATLDFPVASR